MQNARIPKCRRHRALSYSSPTFQALIPVASVFRASELVSLNKPAHGYDLTGFLLAIHCSLPEAAPPPVHASPASLSAGVSPSARPPRWPAP